jgi:predicted deacetylase
MMRGPAQAQYLLRFDDLCPTMDRVRWERFRRLIDRFGLRPILAVVPDNCDPELERDRPDPGFWDEMRTLQAAGATIGLHGYRHLCAVDGSSLIPGHRKTEFAGASLELQREWIGAGLEMLRLRGLQPRIFVAPRHGLDLGTVRVLREGGIELVSDGFAKRPFQDHGLVWIPQQLWRPVEKESGVWTICLHSNSATDEDVAALEAFLKRFSWQFTSVDRVLAEWPIAGRSFSDRRFHGGMVLRRRLSRIQWRLMGR